MQGLREFAQGLREFMQGSRMPRMCAGAIVPKIAQDSRKFMQDLRKFAEALRGTLKRSTHTHSCGMLAHAGITGHTQISTGLVRDAQAQHSHACVRDARARAGIGRIRAGLSKLIQGLHS